MRSSSTAARREEPSPGRGHGDRAVGRACVGAAPAATRRSTSTCYADDDVIVVASRPDWSCTRSGPCGGTLVNGLLRASRRSRRSATSSGRPRAPLDRTRAGCWLRAVGACVREPRAADLGPHRRPPLRRVGVGRMSSPRGVVDARSAFDRAAPACVREWGRTRAPRTSAHRVRTAGARCSTAGSRPGARTNPGALERDRHPIVGDATYGGARADPARPAVPARGRARVRPAATASASRLPTRSTELAEVLDRLERADGDPQIHIKGDCGV